MPTVTKKNKDKPSGRPVVYPEPSVKEFRGKNAMTPDVIREILGWEDDPDDATPHVTELTALFGRRIALHNNTKNRPIRTSWLMTLAQEHLQRRWKMNWETIIVGKTADVQSGQHRMISALLAEHLREQDAETGDGHWKKNWPGPVTLESLVVFGADEDDETFRTLNCGAPATLSDVLFRSSYLDAVPPADRKTVARMADNAVRLLWDRTGMTDSYAPRRTHGESVEFLANHPTVLRALQHVRGENAENVLKTILRPVGLGTAAGLLFLMAASDTDEQAAAAYHEADVRTEAGLNTGALETAEEFFALLAGSSPDLRAVRAAIGSVADSTTGNGTSGEVIEVLLRAWSAFRQRGKVIDDDVRLEYDRDPDGNLSLLGDASTAGGIDLGPPSLRKAKDEDDDEADAPVIEVVEETPAGRRVKSKAEDEADKKAADKPPKTETEVRRAQLDKLREEHAGKVLLFKARTGAGWGAFEQDAQILKKVVGLTPVKNGLTYVAYADHRAKEVVDALHAAGHRVAAVFDTGEGDPTVEDYPNGQASGTPPAGKKRGKKTQNTEAA